MAKKSKGKTKPKSSTKHERKATTTEVDRLERGRKLAASYLVQRDGMDAQLAEDVIGSMSPEDINALIAEANTAVMERTKADDNGKMDTLPDADIATHAEHIEEEELELPDYTEIEMLAAEEEFAGWVVAAAEAARIKNQADKRYKDVKKKVVQLMLKAKAEGVICLGHRLVLYKGHTTWLDEKRLLELGVSADILVQGWADKPYDDVRITPPKD